LSPDATPTRATRPSIGDSRTIRRRARRPMETITTAVEREQAATNPVEELAA
jgi:hypothetical protein